ncbi:MAG: HEAT repeat domain-containing protein [Fimbriimonadaceae bacterium]|nr:HEAT repeat domain-containing protein [Fimbriimonadaceae bacterium]
MGSPLLGWVIVGGALLGLAAGRRLLRETRQWTSPAHSDQLGLALTWLAAVPAVGLLFRNYRQPAAVWGLVLLLALSAVLCWRRQPVAVTTKAGVVLLTGLVLAAELLLARAPANSTDLAVLEWAAWLGGDRALPTLLAVVQQTPDDRPPSTAQLAALRGLGLTSSDAPRRALARLIVARVPQTRVAAATALGDRRDSRWGAAWLHKLASSRSVSATHHAVEMLGALRARQATGPLARRLDDDSMDRPVRLACAVALGRIGDPAGYAALRRATLHGNWALRRQAARARCQFGPLAALGVVGDVLWFVVKCLLCFFLAVFLVALLLGAR